jgi:hypothetical protein
MFQVKTFGKERKPRQRLIFHGPYTGSWGHLFHFFIPITNRLREDNPDAFIVSAGYVGDDFYYKNEHGKYTIDGYIGFPTDPEVRRVYGLGQANYNDSIRNADFICEDYFGKIDVSYKTPDKDNEWFEFLARMPRTHYRLGLFAPPTPDQDDFVVLHSKHSKGLEGRNTKGVEIANADYETDKEYVRLLSQHIKIYVCGISNECYRFNEGQNVIDITQLTAELRPSILLPLTNQARCMISTSSSSTINYANSVGCPSICFACRRYKNNHDTKYNHYGVPTRHHELFPFNPELRVQDTLDFLKEIKDKPRYNTDILRIDTDLVSKWL